LPKHANARGSAHGGLLLTLLDVALGYRAAFSQHPPAALTTASITADFVGAPKLGDWVEAHVDVQKVGSRLAFANAFLTVNGERLVRASAVFPRTTGTLPQSS
jgi:acyl-coenzyme A thioesterase 13